MVWSRPSYQVAKNLGVSGPYLKRKCRQMDIPTPGLGYWAKVKTGQVILKPELPSLKPGMKALWLRTRVHPGGKSRSSGATGKQETNFAGSVLGAKEEERSEQRHDLKAFKLSNLGEPWTDLFELADRWSQTREVTEFLAAARHSAAVFPRKQAESIFQIVSFIEKKLKLPSPADAVLDWAERNEVL